MISWKNGLLRCARNDVNDTWCSACAEAEYGSARSRGLRDKSQRAQLSSSFAVTPPYASFFGVYFPSTHL